MQQVQLTDQLYDQTKLRAIEAGFKSVDDFVARMLSDDIMHDTENLERFFTPGRLALIDKAKAQIKAGQRYSSAEVREHIEKWLDE